MMTSLAGGWNWVFCLPKKDERKIKRHCLKNDVTAREFVVSKEGLEKTSGGQEQVVVNYRGTRR